MYSKRSEMIIVDSDDDFIDTRQNRSVARQKEKKVISVIISDNDADSDHEHLDSYKSSTVVKDDPSFRSKCSIPSKTFKAEKEKYSVRETKRPITSEQSSVLECPNRGNVNKFCLQNLSTFPYLKDKPRLKPQFESTRAISPEPSTVTKTSSVQTGSSDSLCYGRTKRPIKAERSTSSELSRERNYTHNIIKDEPISHPVSALVPVTKTNMPTLRSSSRQPKSDDTKGSESVLERSMSCFKNPRILAINAKTKDTLMSFSEQLDEKSNKTDFIRELWEDCFEKFGSLEREEEWAELHEETLPEDWEDSAFIRYYDRTRVEPGLMLDTDSSDDEDLEIVDPEDDIQRSIKEPHGKDLAQYISAFSKRSKSALGRSYKSESQDKTSLVHISGSMSSKLKGGQFSNYRNSVKISVFGLQLEFSKDYVETLKAMTGQDLRRCAYEISFLMDDKGATSTFKELNESRQLNNSSLVNESHTSELNISLRNKRVFSMLTPLKVKQERLEKSLNTTRCSENSSNKTASLNKSSLNKSTRYTALLNMLTPKKVKQEIKPERNPDCFPYHDRSYRDPTSSPASILDVSLANTSHNGSRCEEKKKQLITAALARMLATPSKPNIQNSSAFLAGLSRSAGTSKRCTSLKTVPERWKSNPDLYQNTMSPMKRNHDVDTTGVDSPSKRLRFNNDSVLSSTRIENTSFVDHPRFDSHGDLNKSVRDRPPQSHVLPSHYDHIPANGPLPHSDHHRGHHPSTTYIVNRNDSHYPPYYSNYPAIQHHQQPYSHYPHQVYGPPHCHESCCVPPRYHHAPHYPPHHAPHYPPNHHPQLPVSVHPNRHQPLRHHQRNVPPAAASSRQIVPSNGSTAAQNAGIQIPIVTDLLKGLNSHDRKLKIRVDYDVKLANDGDKENSF